MTLPDIVKTAVRQSFGEAIARLFRRASFDALSAAEIGDLVVKETRSALQEREADLTRLVREALREALADLMAGR
jgi:predicted metalloendopeptidase